MSHAFVGGPATACGCPRILATPIASVVKSKIQEKTKKYVTSGMIAADEFRVGVMCSTGGCDAGMMEFLSQFAISAAIDFDDLVAEVTNTVMCTTFFGQRRFSVPG